VDQNSRYRICDTDLLDTLDNWNSLMNFHVRLIACGGTALTLLNIKESTKELVLKKYNGEPLNKTEQEYFSRKVKKKLEAMTNKEVRKVTAAALNRK
jgi:hypothetical protein